MTRALEKTQSKLVIVRNELAKHQKLLRNSKNHRKGKRVKLKGRFVYISQKVLEITQEAEAEASNHKGRRRRQKRSLSLELEDSADKVIENLLSDYGSDDIVVATRMAK